MLLFPPFIIVFLGVLYSSFPDRSAGQTTDRAARRISIPDTPWDWRRTGCPRETPQTTLPWGGRIGLPVSWSIWEWI